jgi:glycosyltransferase involved in cell wall biosynthesis
MHLISVVIITLNEEKNISACIDSVKKIADEIIVLDSFSTDRTTAIARRKGAIVEQKRFTGYIQQKNAANALASNNYILSLDADEVLDESLVNSILAAKAGVMADAYVMNRCTNYCGKFIRHGSWYPDRKIRLFNKGVTKWGGFDPHEKIEILTADARIEHLAGDIKHFSFPSIDEQVTKSNKYSSMVAKAMYETGKRSNWFKMLVNPPWAFFYGYFLRRGFLDGFAGFVIAANTGHATFLKYIKLYQLQHSKKIIENTNVAKQSNTLYNKFKKELLHQQTDL